MKYVFDEEPILLKDLGVGEFYINVKNLERVRDGADVQLYIRKKSDRLEAETLLGTKVYAYPKEEVCRARLSEAEIHTVENVKGG